MNREAEAPMPDWWTDEQKVNARRYGVCWCGGPRELEIKRNRKGELMSMWLVCPNGHYEPPDIEITTETAA
jgi:hypothetical protein